MKVDYLITLAFLTAYSLFGISHGQNYYMYNYQPKSYQGFRRIASRPNPNRYSSAETTNYGLAAGWYRNRQDYWKAKKKMYGYPEEMETTAMMSTTEAPSITTAPYPTQDGVAVVSQDQSYPSTMQSAVTQDVQQPYIPGYPETGVVQSQPITQDLSSSSSSSTTSSSSVMSLPLAPDTQDVTSTAAAITAPAQPAPVQPSPVQSMQQETTASPQITQQFETTKFPQPQSHLLPSSSSGSKLVTNAEIKQHNSSRICNPGPPLKPNPRLKNCLVIGDSIALGYLKPVKFLLSNKCQVQHAPFARGSGAMDSRHGLRCLSLFLKTTAMEPTTYDVILFNFGMHDIDYSKRFPEEHVPFEEYKENILKLKESFLKTGAKVAFALTTPFPSDKKRNDRIEKFNAEAVRIMEGGQRIPVVDLYTLVVKRCGKPTYDSCSIMKGPRDVHYNEEGNQLLGVRVAATFATLLDQTPQKKQPPPRKAIVRRYFERGYSDYYIPDDAITCPDAVTRCPLGTTCCESLISLTGYGCCMFPNAVNCPDNWHCCPSGSTCSPNCTVRECKCITFTTSNNGSTISHESKANAKYLAEANINSGTGEHFSKDFKPITDPLLRVLKKLANAHKTSKHHPKKNAQMWTKKLFESKGKLKFKDVKISKSKTMNTNHKTTVNRLKTQHSINVELGHLIEHHHKHQFKDLKTFLKKGVKSKGRGSIHFKKKTKHLHLKDRHLKVKSTPRKLAKPVFHQKGKLHPRKHPKLLNKNHHNDSHHKPESHHKHLQKVYQNDTKDSPSKFHVDHDEHQWNHGLANDSLRNAVNNNAANQSLHRLANHNQSFRYEFVADRKILMKDSNKNSDDSKLKTDKNSKRIKNVAVKSQEDPSISNHFHSSKEDHLYSVDDSGSGENSGLRDIGSASNDFDEEYVSGSGMRDSDPSPITPGRQVPQLSTIKSFKKPAQNTSTESEYFTNATSGSGTPLLNDLLSNSRGDSDSTRDSFDDLNPSGDGHATRQLTEDSDISNASGESLDQTLGESVDDNDDHGFDLMSSALMDNDGANNEVIKEEQSAEKRHDIASSTVGQNGHVAGTLKKTTLQEKVDKGNSPLIARDGIDEDEDDDIRGKHDKTAEHNANHFMDKIKEPFENKEEVEVDFNDNNNLISLDSLLEDNSGYSNETEPGPSAKTWNSYSIPESQNDAHKETPVRSELETSLMSDLPLESLASGYSDDTQGLEQSTIKGSKIDMVENPDEGSASGNASPEAEIMRPYPALEENPEKNVLNSSIKSTLETPKKIAEDSKNNSSVEDNKITSPKKKQNTLQTNGNAIMHVIPSIKSRSGRKFNQLSERQEAKATTKLKYSDIKHSNLKKKNEPKTATSKTFVRKLPKSVGGNSVKFRQKIVHGPRQEQQKERVNSRLGLKGSSKGNKNSKNVAISSSLHVAGKKGLRGYTNKKKSLKKLKTGRKFNKNSAPSSVIGERDDISNENIGDGQSSVQEGESGKGILEAYLATP